MNTRSITDLEGVFAAGVAAGIKRAGGLDLAFIAVPDAVAAAGTYTMNKFRAPCIEYTRRQLEKGTLKAVIINAGNANAATGEQGFQNARRTAEIAASLLKMDPEHIGTASTGIIGVQLPMEKIERGLAALLATPTAREGRVAAEAIMTTDAYRKETYREGRVLDAAVTVAGIAKGAGMIAPNMATMLSFLVTDLAVPQPLLQKCLSEAVDLSFNMTSVDSDSSTNDMVLVFSTGKKKADLSTPEAVAQFSALLTAACTDLAKLIARDGEGAEKLIEATVKGARSRADAKRIALNIINSPLLKTAVHGADPNWGRVVMAIGKDPAPEVDPARVDLFFGPVQILAGGAILPFDRAKVIEIMKGDTVPITVNLNLAGESATAFGCDLTKKYIDINTDYS